MRLLIVEDNVELARLLAKGLTGAGFAVDVLNSAAEARAALTTTHFAALVLDQFAGVAGADPVFGIAIALWLAWGAFSASSQAIDMLMDKEWSEANGAVNPTSASATNPSYAALNANGTGPFVLESHQPGVRTVWKPNAAWWGKPEHNITEAIFTPIASDPTRVAALLSGEVDWIDPVPLQDVARVNASPNATCGLRRSAYCAWAVSCRSRAAARSMTSWS